MNDVTRREIADSLEQLANQEHWKPEIWLRCHDLLQAHLDDELLRSVYDEIVNYSGVFQSQKVFGLRVRPRRYHLQLYQREFRDIATALRLNLPLSSLKKESE